LAHSCGWKKSTSLPMSDHKPKDGTLAGFAEQCTPISKKDPLLRQGEPEDGPFRRRRGLTPAR